MQLCGAAPYMVGCWLWEQCKVGGARYRACPVHRCPVFGTHAASGPHACHAPLLATEHANAQRLRLRRRCAAGEAGWWALRLPSPPLLQRLTPPRCPSALQSGAASGKYCALSSLTANVCSDMPLVSSSSDQLLTQCQADHQPQVLTQ